MLLQHPIVHKNHNKVGPNQVVFSYPRVKCGLIENSLK